MSDKSEQERLRILHQYNLLDTPEEDAFDTLTELAATICNTPISLISLVDADRQWFKSHFGLNVRETPREQSFCARSLGSPDPLLVEDAREDVRFAQNPLVTGDPHIRMYAGVPLQVSEGARLGTLCVIDNRARKLSFEQIRALQLLSLTAVHLMEARLTAEKVHRLEAELANLRKLRPEIA